MNSGRISDSLEASISGPSLPSSVQNKFVAHPASPSEWCTTRSSTWESSGPRTESDITWWKEKQVKCWFGKCTTIGFKRTSIVKCHCLENGNFGDSFGNVHLTSNIFADFYSSGSSTGRGPPYAVFHQRWGTRKEVQIRAEERTNRQCEERTQESIISSRFRLGSQ